jgi:hypothetical protein
MIVMAAVMFPPTESPATAIRPGSRSCSPPWRIYAKLGVSSRVELARLAAERR